MVVVLINGWFFDFKKMRAFRKGDSNVWVCIKGIGTPPSIIKKLPYSYHDNTWTNFFDEPEDHYNNNIDRAYHDFLLAQSIEEMLISETK